MIIDYLLPTMGTRHDPEADDRDHLGLLDDVDFRPVFVLGNHRSGTTLLYQLLTATRRFHAVTAYHVIEGDRLLHNRLAGREDEARRELAALLAERTAADGGKRVIDDVSVSPDLPEEYGFRLRSRRLRPDNVEDFVTFCKKVCWLGGGDRPLLLKNPWDFPNFVFLRERLPSARFVIIHRDPMRVLIELRAVRALFEERAPYHALVDDWYRRIADRPALLAFARWAISPTFGILFREVLGTMRSAAVYFLQNHAALAGCSIEVRYEDLCAEPDATLERIVDFLAAPPSPATAGDDAPATAPAPRIKPRRVRLLDEVTRNEARVRKELADYLAHCGYDAA